ncbi:MAG: mRNA-degrading endonuclease [Cyanobacteria bacterium QS_9_48_30]|nr:MAG: mRNA-degrading endonuclease [Cyanobacteria bacterium QS_3_48_167]PSO95636.1 MAG: mRNA-degrading endonuclease [Cyanobacteria bacterium QS_9_48_30]
MVSYVPARGDFIHLNLNPRSGREQSGKRFALVISPRRFNELSSLGFICPITTVVKDFPFEVRVRENPGRVYGVVLIHHLRSVDWKRRKVEFVEPAPAVVIDEVMDKLNPLICD